MKIKIHLYVMLTMQMTAPRKDSDGPVLAMHIGFAHAENDCWHVGRTVPGRW